MNPSTKRKIDQIKTQIGDVKKDFTDADPKHRDAEVKKKQVQGLQDIIGRMKDQSAKAEKTKENTGKMQSTDHPSQKAKKKGGMVMNPHAGEIENQHSHLPGPVHTTKKTSTFGKFTGTVKMHNTNKNTQAEAYNGYHNNRTGFAKRRREDDEYHTPDPQKHQFKFKVSHPDVNGGEEHDRTVTTGVTTKSKDEMHGHAVNHLTKQGYTIHKYVKEEVELDIKEGAYEDAEENKKSADDAKKQGDMFAHHLHMADHHDNMSQWHASKGRHGEADRHAEKSEKHHEEAMKLKEDTDLEEARKANTASARAELSKRPAKPLTGKDAEDKKKESDAAWERLMAHAAANKKTNEDVDLEEGIVAAAKKVWKAVSDFDSSSPKYDGNTRRRLELRKKVINQKHKQLNTRLGNTRYENTELEENAPVAPAPHIHRIAVTVSDPDHPAVTQRDEKLQKFVRVTHHTADKEEAIARGKKHFAKKGWKVHSAEHVGMVHEEVAANNVGGGNIAGTQGDAGKAAVMTKEPLKRQKLKNFKEFDK